MPTWQWPSHDESVIVAVDLLQASKSNVKEPVASIDSERTPKKRKESKKKQGSTYMLLPSADDSIE